MSQASEIEALRKLNEELRGRVKEWPLPNETRFDSEKTFTYFKQSYEVELEEKESRIKSLKEEKEIERSRYQKENDSMKTELEKLKQKLTNSESETDELRRTKTYVEEQMSLQKGTINKLEKELSDEKLAHHMNANHCQSLKEEFESKEKYYKQIEEHHIAVNNKNLNTIRNDKQKIVDLESNLRDTETKEETMTAKLDIMVERHEEEKSTMLEKISKLETDVKFLNDTGVSLKKEIMEYRSLLKEIEERETVMQGHGQDDKTMTKIQSGKGEPTQEPITDQEGEPTQEPITDQEGEPTQEPITDQEEDSRDSKENDPHQDENVD